jgi:hypothetical protein
VTAEIRPQLGVHAEALIADSLDKRENAIINSVCAKIPSGLDPQWAISQWLAINEIRSLRRSLVKRTEIENARHAKVS